MSHPLLHALSYVGAPVGAAALGSLIAVVRQPSPLMRSTIQHFAAGVVLAAVVAELLPDMAASRMPLLVSVGFILGTALMLLLRNITGEPMRTENEQSHSSTGLVAATAIDNTLDGLITGLGFALGERQGLLLTVALTIEVFLLGIVTSGELSRGGAPRWRSFAIATGIGVLFAAGMLFGAATLGGVSPGIRISLLSFGAAALLYLVFEELLREAHERRDTPSAPVAFLMGFLGILLFHMMSSR